MQNNYVNDIKQSWWKWGNPEKSFKLDRDFPKLAVYLEDKWNTKLKEDFNLPDRISGVDSASYKIEDWRLIFSNLKPHQISVSKEERIQFALGKSYRNSLRILTKEEIFSPDVVVYPEQTMDVQYILEQANKHKINITTFSGGTNVTGAVDIEKSIKTCCVNMQKMNQLLDIDTVSQTATFQAGIYGPALEEILNKKGFTLGHFPQSFEFSTLGGWLATRSAGQESGYYGKIEDMVLGLKAATPSGIIEQFSFPRHAAGIDIFQLFIGSEGTLGIITEAKMKIHPIPKKKNWVVGVFKSYEEGTEALRCMVQAGIHPSISRLSDVQETKMLSLLSKEEHKGISKIANNLMKSYLKNKGYNNPCLLMMQFSIRNASDEIASKLAVQFIKSKNGFHLPSSAAANWHKNRFSLPYMRETLIQSRILIDMFETVTYWNNLIPLYNAIKDSLKNNTDYFEKGGIIFCHVSHIYDTGASLYFTLMAQQQSGNEIKQWENIKSIISNTIVDKGGAISHHHGVGKDHRKWYLQQLTPQTKHLLNAVKLHLDPNNIMNAGKLFDSNIFENKAN